MADLDVGTIVGHAKLDDQLSPAFSKVDSNIGRTSEAIESKLGGFSQNVSSFLGRTADSVSTNVGRINKDAGSLLDTFSTAMPAALQGVEKGAEKLNGELGSSGVALRGVTTSGLETAGALGIAATATAALYKGLYELASGAAQVGDEIQSFAQKTSTSVQEASSLRYAAQLLGKDVNQLGTQMFMLDERVDEGSTKVQRALRDLGINWKAFADLSPEEKLLQISDAFRGLPQNVDKAGIAFELMGRQGKEALPTLLKPLRELTEEGKTLGDQWSEQDVEAARAFEVAINRLGVQVERLKVGIGKEFLGDFEILTNLMTKAVSSGGGGGVVKLVADLVSDVVENATGIHEAVVLLSMADQFISKHPSLFGQQAAPQPATPAEAAKGLGIPLMAPLPAHGPGDALAQATSEASKLKKLYDELGQDKAADNLTDGVKAYIVAALDAGQKTHEIADALIHEHLAGEEVRDAVDRMGQAHQQAAQKAKQHQDALQLVQGAARGLTDAQKALVDEDLAVGASVDEIAKAHNLNALAVKNYVEQAKALNGVTSYVSTLTQAQKELVNVWAAQGAHATEIAKSFDLPIGAVKNWMASVDAMNKQGLERAKIEESIAKQFLSWEEQITKAAEKRAAAQADAVVKQLRDFNEYSAKLNELSMTPEQIERQNLVNLRDSLLRKNFADALATGTVGTVTFTQQQDAIDRYLSGLIRAQDHTYDTLEYRMNQNGVRTKQGLDDLAHNAQLDYEQMLRSGKYTASELEAAWQHYVDVTGAKVGELDRIIVGGIQNFVGNVFTQGVSKALDSALTPVLADLGKNLFKNLDTSVDSAGNVLTGQIGKKLSGALGEGLGTALGLAMPVIGSALFAGLDTLLTDPKTGHGWLHEILWGREGRNDVVDFVNTTYGSFANLQRELAKLPNGQALWVQLTQQVGRRDEDAAKKAIDAIKSAFDDLNNDISKYGLTWKDLPVQDQLDHQRKAADALAASYGRLTSAGYDSDAVIKGMSGDINDWLSDTLDAGQKIPPAMQPIIDKLITMGGLTDDNARKLLGLSTIKLDGGSFDDVMAAAGRYGIQLDALGPKVNQLNIDQQSAQISQDWKLLTSDGEDINAIMEGMKGKVQDVVTAALRFGDEIPLSMKPVIDNMIIAGKLTDQFGNKLTDDSKIKFGADLQDDFQKLIDKINDLVDVLSGNAPGGGLPGAINRVPKNIDISVRYNQGDVPAPPVDNSAGPAPEPSPEPAPVEPPPLPHVATGGMVMRGNVVPFPTPAMPQAFAGGGSVRDRPDQPAQIVQFKPRGIDTELVAAAPGEVILNAAEQGNVAKALQGSEREPSIVVNPPAVDLKSLDFGPVVALLGLIVKNTQQTKQVDLAAVNGEGVIKEKVEPQQTLPGRADAQQTIGMPAPPQRAEGFAAPELPQRAEMFAPPAPPQRAEGFAAPELPQRSQQPPIVDVKGNDAAGAGDLAAVAAALDALARATQRSNVDFAAEEPAPPQRYAPEASATEGVRPASIMPDAGAYDRPADAGKAPSTSVPDDGEQPQGGNFKVEVNFNRGAFDGAVVDSQQRVEQLAEETSNQILEKLKRRGKMLTEWQNTLQIEKAG